MQDVRTMLTGMRRPKLLVAAARLALPGYRRETGLRRLLLREDLPRSTEALVLLMDLERMHDARRRDDDAAYSPLRHLEVLVALMSEAQLLAT